jgi:phosphopantothenoylcysteine decarboxylase/phosphopantothenate--cysteine ligase
MSGREVIIGVTGGIAAYKTAALTSRLVQAGVGVSVVMTASARQLVGEATFAALTSRPVATGVFDRSTHPLGAHIELAENADLLCVAPATANFLGKAAHGIADDLLSTLYLSYSGPVLLAPAMKSEMWDKPVVQRNVQRLLDDGAEFIGPEEGWLSCRKRGVGRMAAPETIFAAIQQLLEQSSEKGRDG